MFLSLNFSFINLIDLILILIKSIKSKFKYEYSARVF